MTPADDDICTKRLMTGESLEVRDAPGCAVMCCAGTVWITQENDARDIFLKAGESFTFDRPGRALIRAEQGMKDEWMNDTGIAVIGLPLRFARATRLAPRRDTAGSTRVSETKSNNKMRGSSPHTPYIRGRIVHFDTASKILLR